MRGTHIKLSVLALLLVAFFVHAQESVTIMQIQGTEQFSPLDGQTVETTGIVTAIGSRGRMFWMQDPGGDGDAATSDGILVSDRTFLEENGVPAIGDLIRVVASVDEQQFAPSLPRTRLENISELEVLSSGNDVPAPIEITNLPDTDLQAGLIFWESLEGMLVSVVNATVVSPTTRFGEFGMIASGDARPGFGFFPRTSHLILQSLGLNRVDYNPERILTDDSIVREDVVRPGDQVKSLTGIMDYTFSAWKIQITQSDITRNPLPDGPASQRFGNMGNTRITTFNIANLFDTEDNPDKDDDDSNLDADELETKLTKIAASIEQELELPAIIVIQEAENDAVLELLAERVNASAGTRYQATSFETSDRRGIEAGFFWDAARVTLFGAFQLSNEAVDAAFGPDSASPGREPIVGSFGINGRTITIIGNHFKSKFGDSPPYGVETLNGEPFTRVTETQRKAQARAVRDFVDGLLVDDPDALIVIAGDFNDFEFGEPGEGLDHTLAILEGITSEVLFTNLINFVEQADRYTFIFDGNSQVLDHILLSPALLELYVGVDILHFNAAYPASLSSDSSTTLRSSDHDPIEVRFEF